MKKILLTTTALKQPWSERDWDMTDGNTYEINRRLNDEEDWDALEDALTELEQAEARIEELEDTLSLRTNLHGEATYLIHKLEAKLAKAVGALEFYTYETTHLSAEEDDGSHWCKISKDCLDHARTTLAELKGQGDE